MISRDLTYEQAQAILAQMAGPGSSERLETTSQTLALTRGQEATPLGDGSSAPSEVSGCTWGAETFRRLIELAPDALIIFDQEGTIGLANTQIERLFGYRRYELLGQSIEALVPEYAQIHHAELRDRFFSQREFPPTSVSLELEGSRKDGRQFPVEISLSPLEAVEGPLFISSIRDISHGKRLEARYQNLVEGIPAVTFMAALDEGKNELYVSPQIEHLLGFSQKEWLGDPILWYTRLHPDDRERWHLEFSLTCATAVPFRSVYRFVARDGHVVWVQGEAKVVRDASGRPLFLQGVAFDITERKEAEDALRRARDELEQQVHERTVELGRANHELRTALKEKESLLKEIHHRVKNNLQVISSLLNLQSTSIKDPATLHAFQESQNRIRSMALIHEKLYQSHDLAHIAFGQYIRELAAYLVRSYGVRSSHVALRVDIGNETLTLDTAIPCGLIITELVSNSLKYAFPDGRKGEIVVSLRADDSGVWTLSTVDNGIGLPSSLDPRNTESLGLQLVSTLADQLEATLDVRSENGTSFVFCFREPPP